MYLPQAGRHSTGVHQVKLGLESRFKPWYFNGLVVFWGGLYSTMSEALEQAEIMKQDLQ